MHGHHAISPNALHERIVQLQSEHGALDRLINKLSDSSEISDLELRRLKKRKLKVKDNILLLQLQQPFFPLPLRRMRPSQILPPPHPQSWTGSTQ